MLVLDRDTVYVPSFTLCAHGDIDNQSSTLFLESRLGLRNLHETVLQAATTNGFTIWRLKYPNSLSHSWWIGVSVWILGKAAKEGGNAREDKGEGRNCRQDEA